MTANRRDIAVNVGAAEGEMSSRQARSPRAVNGVHQYSYDLENEDVFDGEAVHSEDDADGAFEAEHRGSRAVKPKTKTCASACVTKFDTCVDASFNGSGGGFDQPGMMARYELAKRRYGKAKRDLKRFTPASKNFFWWATCVLVTILVFSWLKYMKDARWPGWFWDWLCGPKGDGYRKVLLSIKEKDEKYYMKGLSIKRDEVFKMEHEEDYWAMLKNPFNLTINKNIDFLEFNHYLRDYKEMGAAMDLGNDTLGEQGLIDAKKRDDKATQVQRVKCVLLRNYHERNLDITEEDRVECGLPARAELHPGNLVVSPVASMSDEEFLTLVKTKDETATWNKYSHGGAVNVKEQWDNSGKLQVHPRNDIFPAEFVGGDIEDFNVKKHGEPLEVAVPYKYNYTMNYINTYWRLDRRDKMIHQLRLAGMPSEMIEAGRHEATNPTREELWAENIVEDEVLIEVPGAKVGDKLHKSKVNLFSNMKKFRDARRMYKRVFVEIDRAQEAQNAVFTEFNAEQDAGMSAEYKKFKAQFVAAKQAVENAGQHFPATKEEYYASIKTGLLKNNDNFNRYRVVPNHHDESFNNQLFQKNGQDHVLAIKPTEKAIIFNHGKLWSKAAAQAYEIQEASEQPIRDPVTGDALVMKTPAYRKLAQPIDAADGLKKTAREVDSLKAVPTKQEKNKMIREKAGVDPNDAAAVKANEAKIREILIRQKYSPDKVPLKDQKPMLIFEDDADMCNNFDGEEHAMKELAKEGIVGKEHYTNVNRCVKIHDMVQQYIADINTFCHAEKHTEYWEETSADGKINSVWDEVDMGLRRREAKAKDPALFEKICEKRNLAIALGACTYTDNLIEVSTHHQFPKGMMSENFDGKFDMFFKGQRFSKKHQEKEARAIKSKQKTKKDEDENVRPLWEPVNWQAEKFGRPEIKQIFYFIQAHAYLLWPEAARQLLLGGPIYDVKGMTMNKARSLNMNADVYIGWNAIKDRFNDCPSWSGDNYAMKGKGGLCEKLLPRAERFTAEGNRASGGVLPDLDEQSIALFMPRNHKHTIMQSEAFMEQGGGGDIEHGSFAGGAFGMINNNTWVHLWALLAGGLCAMVFFHLRAREKRIDAGLEYSDVTGVDMDSDDHMDGDDHDLVGGIVKTAPAYINGGSPVAQQESQRLLG